MWNLFTIVLVIGVNLQQFSEGYTAIETRHPTNGVNKGTWATSQLCPNNKYVNGFQIKSDGGSSYAVGTTTSDRQGCTGVRFYCSSTTEIATSGSSKAGTWQAMFFCPASSFVISVKLNVNPAFTKTEDVQNFKDALGVEDVRIRCSDADLTVYDGLSGPIIQVPKPLKSDQLPLLEILGTPENRHSNIQIVEANWGNWANCSPGTFVCGLQTRIDNGGLFNDDMGLTDVVVFCCTI